MVCRRQDPRLWLNPSSPPFWPYSIPCDLRLDHNKNSCVWPRQRPGNHLALPLFLCAFDPCMTDRRPLKPTTVKCLLSCGLIPLSFFSLFSQIDTVCALTSIVSSAPPLMSPHCVLAFYLSLTHTLSNSRVERPSTLHWKG